MPTHKCKTIYTGVLLVLLIIFLASSLRSIRPQNIYDMSEHVQSLAQTDMLVAASKSVGIQKTLLLPSPTETLTLNGKKSFTGYRENTEELFKIAEKYPDRFIVFCTVSPLDPDALQYLEACIKKGGKGLKLYNGHTYYHEVFNQPLNSASMIPIYAYAEKNKLPIIYHVNIVSYGQELENVLKTYPNLVISVPHYMLSSVELEKVVQLLDKYPNLYTDISFGAPEFVAAGFRRISSDPSQFVRFFNNYQDRIMFGTDMVLTDNTPENQSALEKTLTCYKDLLEERRFRCGEVSSYYQQKLIENKDLSDNCLSKDGKNCGDLQKKTALCQQRLDEVTGLNGLGLSDSVLNKVYWENAVHFLKSA